MTKESLQGSNDDPKITTNEVSLGVGTSDMGPRFVNLVQDIAAFVTENKTQAVKVDMHAYNGDWDTLYPFSAVCSRFEWFAFEHSLID